MTFEMGFILLGIIQIFGFFVEGSAGFGCTVKQFDELNKNDIIRYKKQDYEWQVLVANRQKAKKEYPHTLVVPASIDDIMLLYVKGEC